MLFDSTYDGITYSYDAIGRVYRRTAKIGGINYVTQYNYAAGDTARYGANASTPPVSSVAQTGHVLYYRYDDVGNVTRQTYGGKYTYYVYDTLGQLIRVNDPHDPASGATGTTWTYHYDQGGNILNTRRYAHTTGVLGPVLEDIPYAYADANWKDKLTSYNGVPITYDAIGNPLSDGTWTYAWQAGRQLASMGSTGATVNFAYNADGLRVRKTVNSTVTNYILHGKNVVHLTQGSNNLHFFYDASGRPSHVNFNDTMYLYVHNLQGDVIAIRDAAGSNVVTYSYNAWGKQLSKAGTLAATLGTLNPFRYRGYVYDEETGLYYLRSRYYNPAWKRFVNADTTLMHKRHGISFTVYTYCNNSPCGFFDPNGKWGVDTDNINLRKELDNAPGPFTKLTNYEFIAFLMKMVDEKWRYDYKGDKLGMRHGFVDCVSAYRYVIQLYYNAAGYRLFLPKVDGEPTDNVSELVEHGTTGAIVMPTNVSGLDVGVALFTTDESGVYKHVAYYIGNGFAIESNISNELHPLDGVRIINVDELVFTHYAYLNGVEYLGSSSPLY